MVLLTLTGTTDITIWDEKALCFADDKGNLIEIHLPKAETPGKRLLAMIALLEKAKGELMDLAMKELTPVEKR